MKRNSGCVAETVGFVDREGLNYDVVKIGQRLYVCDETHNLNRTGFRDWAGLLLEFPDARKAMR